MDPDAETNGETYNGAREAKAALKITGRSMGLVLLGTMLFHLPFDVGWLAIPVTLVGIFVFIFAFAGLILTAMLWRGLLWHLCKMRGGRQLWLILTAFTVLMVFAAAFGIYRVVGGLLA